jgi:hypothetical protein
MAVELSANALQTLAGNAGIVWTENPVRCNRGLVYAREGSPIVRLASPTTMGMCYRRRCCCSDFPRADYLVTYGANVQIPEGGTVAPISLGVAIDGEVDPSSIRTFTPAAVQTLGELGATLIVSVPSICRCSSISVRNIGANEIEVQNANLNILFDGVKR